MWGALIILFCFPHYNSVTKHYKYDGIPNTTGLAKHSGVLHPATHNGYHYMVVSRLIVAVLIIYVHMLLWGAQAFCGVCR